jgi:DNA-binding response OmpR family regulator
MDQKHVLFVEDDDDDFEFFSSAIAEVLSAVVLKRATNGEVLLELLHTNRPDIVFLDILLPAKNGCDCLREVRANRNFDNLPIIMYSSLKDVEQIELCYREGSNFYIIKPRSFAELKHVLEKILGIDWTKVLYYPARADFIVNPQ